MSEPVRFAIVGLGNIGQRHAAHILANPDATLAAVCDVIPTRMSNMPDDTRRYASLEQLLANEEGNVLCICTPNHLHEPHAILAMRHGWHVVVEKPMAISTASCDRMIAAASENDRIIFAVKQNRYNPPVQEVRKILQGGLLGNLFLVQVNCFWNRGDAYYAESDWRGSKAKDGGCLFTQFSHFVDILYYLNGPVLEASGWVQNFAHQHNTEVEDTGSFVLKGANGSIINFNFTTCAYERNMEGSITLFGEKGTVKIGGQYLNTIEYQRLATGHLPEINISAKANDYGKYQGSMSNHDKVIQNVIDVLHHGQAIMTSAEEGKAVVGIIEMMYAAAVRK